MGVVCGQQKHFLQETVRMVRSLIQVYNLNYYNNQSQMGNHFSVNIESPPFQPQHWKYLPQEELREEYGYYRVLENINTGEKIDEYEFMWPNEDELNYYLKSYNWRYNQSNVVTTKFVDIHNKNELCSRTYTARVYIQHVKLRLSDISDIPYPDNLYVLMEALDGYSKIYEHSKFFYIQENQVCVDEEGNIKIWVNGDLSINYPNVQGHREDGEQEMVDSLVDIINENTDSQTEPKPTFKEYFDQKRGTFGKKFEQARVLVLSYARINNTEIPSRFEAIFNMDLASESGTHKSSLFSERSIRRLQRIPFEQQQNRPVTNYSPYHTQPVAMTTQNHVLFNHNLSLGGLSKIVHPPFNASPLRPVNYLISNIPSKASLNFATPQVVRNTYNVQLRPTVKEQRVIPNAQWAESIPFHATAQPMQPQPTTMTYIKNEGTEIASKSHQQQESRINLNFAGDYEQDIVVDAAELTNKPQNHRNISQNNVSHATSKTQPQLYTEQSNQRGLIAMSLPISPHLQKRPNVELGKMMQQQKAVQSHIDPNMMMRKQGKGLSQLNSNNGRMRLDSGRRSREEKMSLKYYSSLYNELEIDPEIAADLAKFAAR